MAVAPRETKTITVETVSDLVMYQASAQTKDVQVVTEMKAGRRTKVAGRGEFSGINCFWVPASVEKMVLYVGGESVARYEAGDARGERRVIDEVIYVAWRPFTPFFPLEALLFHMVEVESSTDGRLLCDGFYYRGGPFTGLPKVSFGELMIPMTDGAWGNGEQRENIFLVANGCGVLQYSS